MRKNTGVIIALAVFSVLAVFLSSCKKETPKDIVIDINVAADKLLSSVSYDDELSLLDDEAALNLYGIEESAIVEGVVYVGTAATVEEIAIFRAVDEETVDDIIARYNDRINLQRTVYADYRPAEVPKLDAAVVKKQGTVAILCISNDAEAAEQIVKDITENGTDK
ncbi:MAG: DUF4358 domain-containing protein [Clostridiales bacterium]|nr:DUF4358 domain-containing protein [Clostridiales bacterium]